VCRPLSPGFAGPRSTSAQRSHQRERRTARPESDARPGERPSTCAEDRETENDLYFSESSTVDFGATKMAHTTATTTGSPIPSSHLRALLRAASKPQTPMATKGHQSQVETAGPGLRF
jgi:hypothetical protein